MITGVNATENIKLSRCSAGHKSLWAAEWGGFPPSDFFHHLDPLLAAFVSHTDSRTYTCDEPAGSLNKDWAIALGLPPDVLVGIGNTDAHAGAVGAGVKYKTLVQNIGTSSCNMTVMPVDKMNDRQIEGISGQVVGSIVPGMIGFEAGMSAFGDVFAWFAKMICSAVENWISDISLSDIITDLTYKAEQLPVTEEALIATDWFNGRRNPYINYRLKATLTDLTLASSAPDIFRALVEATVFGSRAIVDHLTDNGVEIEEIIAVGGISRKSPYIMQVMADVLNLPIQVSSCEHSCALGAAMFAAVVAGIYPTLEESQQVLKKEIMQVYIPNKSRNVIYNKRYQKYKQIGDFSATPLS